MMKIQTKQRGKVLSVRKTVVEQTRLRKSYERRLYRQMVTFFEQTGRRAVRELGSGRMDIVDTETRLSQILLPHYRAVMENFSNRFAFTKQEVEFERLVRAWMNSVGGNRITSISENTRRKIRKIVLDGQIEGLGQERIGRNIRKQMSEPFTRYRSAMISRTETHNAANYANYSSAKNVGLPMKKRWVSTADDRTRSHHANMNGVEVDIDEPFLVTYKGVVYKMQHAGDPNGGAGNLINCRCVILYIEPDDFVIDEDTPQDEPLPTAKPLPLETVSLIDIASIVRVTQRGKSLSKEYNDKINNGTNDIQKAVINKTRKPRTIAQEGSRGYYRDSDRRIVSDLNDDTLVHEYGHYIDFETGKRVFGEREAWSVGNRDFRQAFNDDALKLGLTKVSADEVNNKLKELKELLFTREVYEEAITRGRYKGNIRKKVRLNDNFDQASSVSDIIDAMVKGKFYNDFFCYGHGKTYYRRGGNDVIEVFANLFAIIGRGGQGYTEAKKLFPSLVREMEKRLLEIERL